MAKGPFDKATILCERITNPSPGINLPFIMRDRVGLEIFIKEYQRKDRSGLLSMYDKFEPKGIAMGLPPYDKDVRIKWIDKLLKTFFNIMAVCGEKIIGHAAISLFPPMTCPEYLIFLHQDFRCRGIGTRLTSTAQKICRELGCERLWVTVSTHNSRAINLFKKLGFRFSGIVDSEHEMVFYLRPRSAASRIASKIKRLPATP